MKIKIKRYKKVKSTNDTALKLIKNNFSQPIEGPMVVERTKGVLPSPKEIKGVFSVTGRYSLYLFIKPG